MSTKYFKDENDTVRAIEPGQEFLITSDWVEMSTKEVDLIINPPDPPPTNIDVNLERDSRVILGSTFDVTGYGPVRIGGDEQTQTNLLGLVQAASLRISQGDVSTITHYRDEDNVIHALTPPQIIDLWSQGSAFVSAVFQASWELKDDPNGIPLDYDADYRWP